MLRTPAWVLMTEGTKAAKKMTMILAVSPSPNHRMASGIQAKGGMGRSSMNTGFSTASAVALVPISRPRGTPTATDTTKPSATSFSDCSTCTTSVASP